MAKALTTMPSSINTTSTENDSLHSPRHSGFGPVNGDSPATSTSDSPSSPHRDRNGYNTQSLQHYEPYHTKRKRAGSLEEGGHSPRRYNYSPPKRLEHQHMADRALHVLGDPHPHIPPAYYSPGGDGRPSYWGDREQSESITVHTTDDGLNDDGSDQYTSPPPGTIGQTGGDTGTPPPRSGGPIVQINKRKRNFSNRTKTGCMTCRGRKKKCDEGRPVCNNCSKGGFQCQGYTVVRGVWPKSSESKRPIPLQSKPDDGPPSSLEVAYKDDAEPTSAHPAHHSNAAQQLTPIDPHVEPAHSQHPQRSDSRGRASYSGQPWPPQQGHPSYTKELPPLSELARPDSSKPEYSSAPPRRDMSRPPNQSVPPPPPPPAPNPQSGHWPPPAQAEHYRSFNPPPRLDTHPAPPMRVPATPYDYQKSGAKTFTVEEVQRSRMLRHTRFNYFDQTLKNERQRCAEALARYNNACTLRSGVTEEEAQKMLMKVFDPALDTTHHPIAPCKEKGVLGPGVKIEGPFKCTYGYNLRVMDNVFIGENTKIDDSARVEIGVRTWIGPNVTILTTEFARDMVDRKGTESLCSAAPVTIHAEVVVGQNAVIYPGVVLGRGATVEAFAVVRTSLGENQVQQAAVGPRSS